MNSSNRAGGPGFSTNPMSRKESFAVTHKGCRIACSRSGTGVPILFIQGVGVHGSGWGPQVDVLDARYQCLTFDNRGLNKSQPIGTPLSIEQMAEDALSVLKARTTDPAHIVGHSMGGLIALQLALSARNSVRSLALLCTFSRGKDATKLSPWMIWTGLRTRIGTKRQRRRAFLKLVLPPATFACSNLDEVARQFAPIFGHDLAVQPPVAMKQLTAMARYDATPRLHQLSGLPTLVVSATHDRLARPEYGRGLAAAIRGARFVEIKDAAHGVPIERPESINSLLLEHFSRST